MLYNAVLRNYGSQTLLGRVFLYRLEDVPRRDWMIEYRGSIINRNTDLASLFVSNKEPLHLVKLHLLEDEKVVRISIDCNKERKIIAIPVKEDTTVEMLREKIQKAEGIPKDKQRLEYCGERLDGEKMLTDYDVDSCDVIELRLPLFGGGVSGGFLAVDIERQQIKGHCIPVQEIWQMYDLGINIYGKCPEANCCSKKSKSQEVAINMKYGRLRLEVGKCNFPCSACKTGSITPTNFLVTRGRALFRYKKAGVREKVKNVLLESFGSFDEYKTFADPTISNQMTRYDFIEITTVGIESSPFHCVTCNFAIEEKEVVLNCGHAVHPNCVEYNAVQRYRRECRVCNTKWCAQIPDDDSDSGLNGVDDDYVNVLNDPTSAAQDEWRSEYEEMCHGQCMRLKRKVTWNLNDGRVTRSKPAEDN